MQALPEPVADAGCRIVGLALTLGRAEAQTMYARHLRRVLGDDLSESEVRTWTRHGVPRVRAVLDGGGTTAGSSCRARSRRA